MSFIEFHTSALLEPIAYVEERLEKKTFVINGFKNSFNNKKMITYFKDKNRKSKQG